MFSSNAHGYEPKNWKFFTPKNDSVQASEEDQKKKLETQSLEPKEKGDTFLGWIMGGSAIEKTENSKECLDKHIDKNKPG
jgi:hypothetical protein